MQDDFDKDMVVVDEQAALGGVGRWLPGVVVISAIAGFIALAWYAYHTGTQSVKDEDLLVVEADKTPMKEKPLDPGGMKFPNQDKTIFETFANNQQMPPKVERVLPAPEEPQLKNIDTSETKTWVNEKLQKTATEKEEALPVTAEPEKIPAPEKLIGDTDKKKAAPVKAVAVVTAEKEKTPAAEAITDASAGISSFNSGKVVDSAGKPVMQQQAQTPAPVESENKAANNLAAGNAKIQLGAYRSEKEAKAAWEKMQQAHPELSEKTIYVVKADLGAKGVYYRLRAGGIADADDAKSLCGRLTARGQACMLVKE